MDVTTKIAKDSHTLCARDMYLEATNQVNQAIAVSSDTKEIMCAYGARLRRERHLGLRDNIAIGLVLTILEREIKGRVA